MKNAAVGVRVLDWGISPITQGHGWIDLELTGSFQDENGQVVFREPKRVTVPLPDSATHSKNPQHDTGLHPLDIRSDPRRRGPI